MTARSPSAQKVQETLAIRGFAAQVREFSESTRTSAEAAQAIGCEVAQIAKSLIFKTKNSQTPLLVIASGANRVDEKKVRAHIGEKLSKADADFVRTVTGFAIGGVPPIGHAQPLRTLIDADLMQYAVIWAAAGTPHAVFPLTPEELVRITGGEVVEIKQETP
ncbi:MAG: YbaK/EbsC family protein [Anaerolineales bacterium]